MYRTPLTLLTTGLALVLLTAGSAVAQDEVPARSSVRGFSVSAGGSTTLFGRDGAEDVEHERRIWLTAGYGVTDRVAFHLATSGERAGLGLSELEGRYTFGARAARWRPHAAIGLTGLTSHRDAADAQGEGKARVSVRPMLAGGLSYYFLPSLAMDWSVRHTFIKDSRLRCQDGGERAACTPSTRLYVGVSWYPWAR